MPGGARCACIANPSPKVANILTSPQPPMNLKSPTAVVMKMVLMMTACATAEPAGQAIGGAVRFSVSVCQFLSFFFFFFPYFSTFPPLEIFFFSSSLLRYHRIPLVFICCFPRRCLPTAFSRTVFFSSLVTCVLFSPNESCLYRFRIRIHGRMQVKSLKAVISQQHM